MTSHSRRHRPLVTVAALAVVAAGLVPTTAARAVDSGADPVVVAAGDLACQTLTSGTGTATCQSGAVADLIRQIGPDRFLALGDLQYTNGKLSEFQRVWDVQFGDLKAITSPVPGNHDYGTPDAAGYYTYFGAAAAPPHGYYSFDLGKWHIVAMNSQTCRTEPGCGPGTLQYEWLVADLAANAATSCVLGFMHHPRYDWRPWQKWVVDDGTTRNGGSSTAPVVPLWEAMDVAGVDVVLNGDNHLYQRWAPQDAQGNAKAGGTVQFTVGTGGRVLYPFGRPPQPANLAATQNAAFGVLELVLHDGSYSYAWRSAPGQPAYADTGTTACS